MLQKGAVELVEQRGPGFYSRLFVVEKVTGGTETCHRPLITEQLRNHNEVQNGDHRFSPGVSPPRGLDVLHRPPGRILPNPGPLGVSPVSTLLPQGKCLPVQGVVLRPVFGFLSLHQSLRSGFGVAALEGSAPSPLSGRLAGGCRVTGTCFFAIRTFFYSCALI